MDNILIVSLIVTPIAFVIAFLVSATHYKRKEREMIESFLETIKALHAIFDEELERLKNEITLEYAKELVANRLLEESKDEVKH